MKGEMTKRRRLIVDRPIDKPNFGKALEMLDFFDEMNKKYYDGNYDDNDEIQKTSDVMYYGGLYNMLEEVTGMEIKKNKEGHHYLAGPRDQDTMPDCLNNDESMVDSIPLKWLRNQWGYAVDRGDEAFALAIDRIIVVWQEERRVSD